MVLDGMVWRPPKETRIARLIRTRRSNVKPTPVGKTKDAGWQIGVSRTIAVDLDTAWDYLISNEGIEVWLGAGVETPLSVGQTYTTNTGVSGEVRSIRDHDRVRLTWQPTDRVEPATIQIALVRAASGCTFRFHTERLADNEDRKRMRRHWKAIADQIENVLIE